MANQQKISTYISYAHLAAIQFTEIGDLRSTVTSGTTDYMTYGT